MQAYRLTRWLKKETIGRLGIDGRQILAGLGGRALLGKDGDESEDGDGKVGTGIERERIEAADKLRLWLSDMPDTFITVTGPPGSGKTALVGAVTSDAKSVFPGTVCIPKAEGSTCAIGMSSLWTAQRL